MGSARTEAEVAEVGAAAAAAAAAAVVVEEDPASLRTRSEKGQGFYMG